MRAALVVAHPDDETLWGAGWILTRPEDSFAVWCCSTPRIDPKRGEQFFDACRVLDVPGVAFTGKDYPGRPLDLSGLDGVLDNYDYVVTHNGLGEYGNAHHIQVHRYVVHVAYRGPIITFGRGLRKSDYAVLLSEEQRAKKLQALQCYSNVSPTDRKPKWKALLERYFDDDVTRLGEETYVQFR